MWISSRRAFRMRHPLNLVRPCLSGFLTCYPFPIDLPISLSVCCLRYQEHCPNVDRVSACIRMHHPQYSNEAVEEHLELCVENGVIAKVVNKGQTSYRDPESGPGRGQKTLHVTGDMDLSKVRWGTHWVLCWTLNGPRMLAHCMWWAKEYWA